MPMRIAKPILLVTTPLGVVIGIHEAYRLTGGLVILLLALIGVFGVAMASVVSVIRRESSAAAVAGRRDTEGVKS